MTYRRTSYLDMAANYLDGRNRQFVMNCAGRHIETLGYKVTTEAA